MDSTPEAPTNQFIVEPQGSAYHTDEQLLRRFRDRVQLQPELFTVLLGTVPNEDPTDIAKLDADDPQDLLSFAVSRRGTQGYSFGDKTEKAINESKLVGQLLAGVIEARQQRDRGQERRLQQAYRAARLQVYIGTVIAGRKQTTDPEAAVPNEDVPLSASNSTRAAA